MRTVAHWAVALTIFYFWVNAMANNPKKIEAFRQEMNALVDKGMTALKEAVS